MNIERRSFLALTVSIAACHATQAGPAEPMPARATTVVVPAPPPGLTAMDAGLVANAAPVTGDSDDEAQLLGLLQTTTTTEGSARARSLSLCERSATTFDAKKRVCDDTNVGKAKPGLCTRMKAAQGCGGDFPLPREECASWQTTLKPKVAERATACALRLTGREVCDACLTYRCGFDALMGACPDPSADTECTAIASRCKGTSMDECRGFLSGMTAEGRARMGKCMTGTGCSFGLYACSEGL